MAAQKSIEDILAELQGMQPATAPPPPQQQPQQPVSMMAISNSPTQLTSTRTDTDITSLLTALNNPPPEPQTRPSLPPPHQLPGSRPSSSPQKASKDAIAKQPPPNPHKSGSVAPQIKMEHEASTPPTPDPVTVVRKAASTVTTWPAAMRHIMKLSSTDENFDAAVSALIKEQRRKCADWEEGLRDANKRIQERGGEGDRPPRGIDDPGWHSHGMPWKFLEAVHSKASRMQRQHTSALEGLGVPFFCFSPCLVAHHGPEEGKLTPAELDALEAQMVGHLEMLYGDDA